ncbi:MAG: cobalamin biosynthesis protein [Leptospirales bacterium]
MIDLTLETTPELNATKPFLLVAITKHGVTLARKIKEQFTESDLFYPDKFTYGDEKEKNIYLYKGNVRVLLEKAFHKYEGIIAIVSLGAIIRLVAPLLKDKKTDPAVVVIDEAGKYVISALSGHIGGANELSRNLAKIIGGEAVITTASDVGKTLPVDILGRRFGWVSETDAPLLATSAAIVNEEPVALIQESGETNWWEHESPLPSNIHQFNSLAEIAEPGSFKASIIITHRLLSEKELGTLETTVVIRPKSIVLGIGCNRNTSMEELESVVSETLLEMKFSLTSVAVVCSIDLKKDEKGLLSLCERYEWPFHVYSAEELNKIEIESPSETVFKYTGAYGVSEPAAKLYSENSNLELVKKKSGNVTISVGILARAGFLHKE